MPLETTVYIDGFNLYYRALRQTQYKWLNLRLLCELVLGRQYSVSSIRYYTARVSGKIDSDQPKRQNAYLRAISTLPGVSIHYGKFLVNTTWLPLARLSRKGKRFVEVKRPEEKGSDVNLASHLIHDAHLKRFQAAAVVSCDTDLVEPVRIIRDEISLPICVIPTTTRSSKSLKKVATEVRHLTENRLRRAQLPPTVLDSKGREIRKPPSW